MRVSFLIPALDEASTILEVLERVEALGLEKQIVVVDDGSTDGTRDLLDEWARTLPEHVVLHQENRG